MFIQSWQSRIVPQLVTGRASSLSKVACRLCPWLLLYLQAAQRVVPTHCSSSQQIGIYFAQRFGQSLDFVPGVPGFPIQCTFLFSRALPPNLRNFLFALTSQGYGLRNKCSELSLWMVIRKSGDGLEFIGSVEGPSVVRKFTTWMEAGTVISTTDMKWSRAQVLVSWEQAFMHRCFWLGLLSTVLRFSGTCDGL